MPRVARDAIERDLRDPELWAFITGRAAADPTHIGLLLDTIAGGPTGRDRPLFYTFETLKERVTASPQEFWNEVVHLHSLVMGWHDSRDLFHKVGFLIDQRTPFSALIERSRDLPHSRFEAGLYDLIRDRLSLSEEGLRELGYQSDKTSRVLLLMNIETIRQRRHSSERYSFKEHAAGQWSLEHIHAQSAQQLNRAEQWEEWLRLHRKALTAFDEVDQVRQKAVLDRVEEVLASPPVKEADFRPLERELAELLSAGSDTADGALDSIANLALLPGSDNSALGNSVFAVKRAEILERDRRGSYIPVCTRNVFLKYYSSPDEHQMLFWSASDREHYLRAMTDILRRYLRADEKAAQ